MCDVKSAGMLTGYTLLCSDVTHRRRHARVPADALSRAARQACQATEATQHMPSACGQQGLTDLRYLRAEPYLSLMKAMVSSIVSLVAAMTSFVVRYTAQFAQHQITCRSLEAACGL